MVQTDFTDNYSPGCQLCQQGRWLCIFLTYLCDAACRFCPAPFKQEDRIISAFGEDPAIILQFLKHYPFNGISFSGGECFLVFDRLIDWLTFFKKRLPDFYFWAYTNGLAADETKLQRLADNGLHEIRFNIAAADYDAPEVLENINISTHLFEHVAVEIPSIPGDYQKVTAILPYLDSIGVNYLNLHEYILTPDDPQTKTALSDTFVLNKKTKMKYDTQSLGNTDRIRQFCKENQLHIKVNNCSLEKKEMQMLQRRLMMGSIFRKEYEHLTDDGLLMTYFAHQDDLPDSEIQRFLSHENINQYFHHPVMFDTGTLSNYTTIAKLFFLPPLSLDGKRILYRLENVNSGE